MDPSEAFLFTFPDVYCGITEALHDRLHERLGPLIVGVGADQTAGSVVVQTSSAPTAEQLAVIGQLVTTFQCPETYEFVVQSDQCAVNSAVVGGPGLQTMQSFIMARANLTPEGLHCDKLKVLLRVDAAPGAYAAGDAVSVQLACADYATDALKVAAGADLTEAAAERWAPALAAGQPAPSLIKSIMFEGVAAKTPHSDAVWLLKGATSAPGITITVTSMQQLYSRTLSRMFPPPPGA